MATLEVCLEKEVKNLGKTKCYSMPVLFKRCIEAPKGWFLEPADYASKAALKTKLQALLTNPYATRGYLFPPFANVPEDQSEASIYVDTPYGRTPVRDGQRRFLHAISQNLCVHKALQTHRKINDGTILYLDVENKLLLQEPNEDGNLYPLDLALLWTEKMKISKGDDSSLSPFVVDLADSRQIDVYGVLIDGTVVNELEPLTDVVIELAAGDAFAAAEFYVDVLLECDRTPVTGLADADFVMYAADGVTEQPILSADEDENTPGRYHIMAPISPANVFEDGYLTLAAPSLLTIKAYEVQEPLLVNIP